VRRVIVDGYNVLRGTSRYADLARRDLDAARERLISDLGARAAEGEPVTVVFDGGSNPASDGEPRTAGGITVVFSPHGADADAVIEALAAQAREAGEEALVVTTDSATRWTALGGTVTVQRSDAFADELAGDEKSWREHARDGGGVTVSDRIDPATRARLSRMSRGESP
jgi:predicted RNA-binding protein with PIN domain